MGKAVGMDKVMKMDKAIVLGMAMGWTMLRCWA